VGLGRSFAPKLDMPTYIGTNFSQGVNFSRRLKNSFQNSPQDTPPGDELASRVAPPEPKRVDKEEANSSPATARRSKPGVYFFDTPLCPKGSESKFSSYKHGQTLHTKNFERQYIFRKMLDLKAKISNVYPFKLHLFKVLSVKNGQN
jgi:hypothetical protein